MATGLNSRKQRTFDWVLFLIVLALCAVGVVNLYSASAVDGSRSYLTQLIWIMIGGAGAAVIASLDYRHAERWSYVIYGAVLFMLLLVPIIGVERNNSTRWLSFGVFDAQPSELMKVAIILVTARYFHEHERPEGHGLRDLLIPFMLVGVPSLLILQQPDLGTTITVCLIFFTICVFERIKRGTLLLLGGAGVVMIPVMWLYVMKDYQKARVTAFLNPAEHFHEDAWQVIQAKIAIGSGGLGGKGYLQGTQVQNGFVPYHMNDFIFVHHGEQFGFIGSAALILLYFALIVWSLRVARWGRDRFAVLCAVGVAALFFWHVVINLGMVLGLLPVVGLWLPFASFGGSSMLTVFLSVGLLMSISMRRFGF